MIERSFSVIESIQDSNVDNRIIKEEGTFIRDQMRSFQLHELEEIPKVVSNQDDFIDKHIIRDAMVSYKL